MQTHYVLRQGEVNEEMNSWGSQINNTNKQGRFDLKRWARFRYTAGRGLHKTTGKNVQK